MITAYLFDLDGTLQDTEVIYVEAWRLAYADKGCPATVEQSQRYVYGRAKTEVFAAFHERYPHAYSSIEQLDITLARHFTDLRRHREVRIHSSIDLLKRLSRQFPTAIVSGNARGDIAEAVRHLDIEADVQFWLGCEDYSPGKPHPACFLLAAQRLNCTPEQCLVFEDSTAGVTAAKRAGMACVALQRPGTPRQDLSAADCIFTDLADFHHEKWPAS
jgi:HAD superfamily hydrolase (TIGR01509 family)